MGGWARFKIGSTLKNGCIHSGFGMTPLQAQRVEGDLSGLVWPAASAVGGAGGIR